VTTFVGKTSWWCTCCKRDTWLCTFYRENLKLLVVQLKLPPPPVPLLVNQNCQWVCLHLSRNIFFQVLTNSSSPQSTRGCWHLTGRDWRRQRRQDGKGDSRETSDFITSCPTGMFLLTDSSCPRKGSLLFTQSGLCGNGRRGWEGVLVQIGPHWAKSLDGRP